MLSIVVYSGVIIGTGSDLPMYLSDSVRCLLYGFSTPREESLMIGRTPIGKFTTSMIGIGAMYEDT
jgi:hypothetical protein